MGSFPYQRQVGPILMLAAPAVALIFGFEVFFPVVVTSSIGALIWLVCGALATERAVGRLTCQLVYDLRSWDHERQELVCSELNETERKRILSKINY